MTSSLSLFLGGHPSAFESLVEFQRLDENDEVAAVQVRWKDNDDWEEVGRKLTSALISAHPFGVCERCQLEIDIEDGISVSLKIHTTLPTIKSIVFSRISGSGYCDERYLRPMIQEGRCHTITRLEAHEGFPFFLPSTLGTEWTSLTHLNLTSAGLMGLPSAIGNYGQLRELRLSNNRLSHLPKELGYLKHLEVLFADRNELLSIPADLCDCCNLTDLNLECNRLTTIVLDLRTFPRLHSLQLLGNPLSYIPELSVCKALRSLSLMNLRVWSDAEYSQFEVTIEGSTGLASGTKLNGLFAMIFGRSSSQHPLLAGALGRLAEYRINCDAILEQPASPLQQLILMVLSPDSVVQAQAAKVIGLMMYSLSTAEVFVKNGILSAMLTVLDVDRQETKVFALKALSAMATSGDAISVALLVPQLIEKLRTFVHPSAPTAVRHLALQAMGNLSFASENKAVISSVPGLKESLRTLARASTSLDRDSRLLACRCLAILGEHAEVDAIVGRAPIGRRGIRILSIDGGGMKGLAAVKMLKEIETRTGRPIADCFDLIGGTSTGAMLAVSLGILRFSLQRCEEIYKKLGHRVFNNAQEEDQSGWKDSLFRMYRSGQQGLRVVMAGCKHDASTFETLLKEMCSELSEKAIGSLYIDSSVLPGPKVFAVATLTSIIPAMPFLFRNYEFSQKKVALKDISSLGSSKFDLWQGVRASSAAPYFFEDFKLDGLHFQDGAITANNPTALAVQQGKLLWPDNPIECVVSIGLGAIPPAQREKSTSSFIESGSVLIESCCSVERTHEMMSLMAVTAPEMQYFRFNPVDARCEIVLDELNLEKWSRLEAATEDYIRKNAAVFQRAAEMLTAHDSMLMGPSPLDSDVGKMFNPNGALLIVRGRQQREEDIIGHPLHHLSDCAGTIDVGSKRLWPHNGFKGDALFSVETEARSTASQQDAMTDVTGYGMTGAAYLTQIGRRCSGLISALHLELETIENGTKLVLERSTSLWPVADASPESASLKSLLGIEDSIDLSTVIPIGETVEHFGSTCRRISRCQLISGHIDIFERSDPKETMQSSDLEELGQLLEGALLTSPFHLGETVIDRCLSAGAIAVVSRKEHIKVPLHDAICFFKCFYDSIFSGRSIQIALKDAELLVPQIHKAFTLSNETL